MKRWLWPSVVFLVLGACAAPATPTLTPTPTPTPSPTPTFEQTRTAVALYLRTFNRIDNDHTQVSQEIQVPLSGAEDFSRMSAADLMRLNRSLGQLVTASQGALQRTEDIVPPDVEEVAAHLQAYQQWLRDETSAIESIKGAFLAGDEMAWVRAVTHLLLLSDKAYALNRSTESIMAKFNISDAEVDYQFRGR